MQEISRDHVIFSFDRNHPPVARARSGETVVFHTHDCFSGAITREEQLITDIDFSKVNPATGPLAIEEAEPGDTLEIKILDISVEEQAVMVLAPGFGLLGEEINEPHTKILLVDDTVHFNHHTLPKRPMIGVIGLAPAGTPVPTGTPHQHGGNMDCRFIGAGTSLYLPVEVSGGLLALGDLHAVMGDGEIGVSGAEIAGTVTVSVHVHKGSDIPAPALQREDTLAILRSAQTLEEASRLATTAMVDFLEARGYSRADAIMLCSAIGDLRVCQVVNPNVTMRMEIPREVLEEPTSG